MFFMHDGAPAHFSRAVREYLNGRFREKWIGRGGPIQWPARSPDLNPLDFFLWGHLKNKVYKQEHNDVESLRNQIIIKCNEIKTNNACLINIRRSLISRVQKCIEVNGSHFEQLLH